MKPRSDPGARLTLSIMKACEALRVDRSTIYRYMTNGCVEYVRTTGGSIRVLADTLAGADRRRNDSFKRSLLARQSVRHARTPNHRTPAGVPENHRSPETHCVTFRSSGGPVVRTSSEILVGPPTPRARAVQAGLSVENLYESTEWE